MIQSELVPLPELSRAVHRLAAAGRRIFQIDVTKKGYEIRHAEDRGQFVALPKDDKPFSNCHGPVRVQQTETGAAPDTVPDLFTKSGTKG